LILLYTFFAVGRDDNDGVIPSENKNGPHSSDLAQSEDAHSLLSKITIGTLATELVTTIEPKSIASGTVYWVGTNVRRIHFQIEPNKQIWFEISGLPNGNE